MLSKVFLVPAVLARQGCFSNMFQPQATYTKSPAKHFKIAKQKCVRAHPACNELTTIYVDGNVSLSA